MLYYGILATLVIAIVAFGYFGLSKTSMACAGTLVGYLIGYQLASAQATELLTRFELTEAQRQAIPAMVAEMNLHFTWLAIAGLVLIVCVAIVEVNSSGK